MLGVDSKTSRFLLTSPLPEPVLAMVLLQLQLQLQQQLTIHLKINLKVPKKPKVFFEDVQALEDQSRTPTNLPLINPTNLQLPPLRNSMAIQQLHHLRPLNNFLKVQECLIASASPVELSLILPRLGGLPTNVEDARGITRSSKLIGQVENQLKKSIQLQEEEDLK